MLLILCLIFAGWLQASISHSEHQQRRGALKQALPGAVIVLDGATEQEKGGLRGGFFQESNFLYLSGWREPNAWLILAPEREILLLPDRNEVRERYTGRKLDSRDPDAPKATGFQEVTSTQRFDEILKDLAGGSAPVYAMPKSAAAERAAKAAGRATEDLTKPIAGLRMIKSDREIELIRRSTDASVDAHLAAWRRTAAGLYEYQVAATMTQVYLEQGCERSAYSPIVAAGPNAVILHYALNRRRMDRGELLLMDVGAECTGYAADLTRTIPVSGRFTPRQREVYEVVIGAQEAAIQAAKPGMKLLGTGEDSLNGIALKYVNAHGLEKFYLHSLGHHVGLDVHDLTDPALELKPGMVITIEPGVYIAEEQIGVRIEDMVLITKNGAEVLSRRLPRKPADIEKAMRRK